MKAILFEKLTVNDLNNTKAGVEGEPINPDDDIQDKPVNYLCPKSLTDGLGNCTS